MACRSGATVAARWRTRPSSPRSPRRSPRRLRDRGESPRGGAPSSDSLIPEKGETHDLGSVRAPSIGQGRFLRGRDVARPRGLGGGRGTGRGVELEVELAVLEHRLDVAALGEPSEEDVVGERLLDLVLDGAGERP